jgi:CheY-like chemotaxis protein
MIVLVDDDDEDAFVLRKAFSGGRVAVDFEHLLGGGDLMTYLDGTPRSSPSLILLDINMPGMDGFQVLRTLRSDDATRTIPVVMFTTSSLVEDIDRAYREGANSYFVKPSSVEDLRKFVDSFDQYWFQGAKLPSQGR